MRLKSVGVAAAAAVVTAGSVLIGMAPAGAAPAHPQHLVCDVENTYKITSHTYSQLHQIGPTYQLLNKSHSTADLTATTTVSGSVGITLSGSITAEESVILASTKQTLTASATATLTVSVGLSGKVSVRPGKVGDIQFGVFRVKTVGTYTHIDQICRVTSGTVTAYTPYRVGYIASGG